jgi:hypothetical protein
MDDKSSPTIDNTEKVDLEQQRYLGQLSTKEKIALETAKVVLGSSFNIEKSIGYIEQKINKIV